MRRYACVAMAAVALSGCVAAKQSSTRTAALDFPEGSRSRTYYYSVQTEKVDDDCLPPKLLAVLGHIRERTGSRPVLTSGSRSHGRRGSMHRHCKAADIRVPGVSEAAVLAAARSAPGVGGVGRYCNGIVHVDVGPRREWSHCATRSRRTRR